MSDPRDGGGRPLALGVDVAVGTSDEPWLHGRLDADPIVRAWSMSVEPYDVDVLVERRLREASADAGMLAVAANYPRPRSVSCWWAWREPATGSIVAVPTLAPGAVARVDLGADLVQVIEPALMTEDGALEVYVVLSGDRLARLAFPPPDRATGLPPAASVAWEVPLPSGVTSGRAALGPRSAGALGARRLVFAAPSPDGLVLHRLDVDDAGAPGAWRAVELPDVHVVSGEGDVRVRAPDRVETSWLAAFGPRLVLAVVAWRADDVAFDLRPVAPAPPGGAHGAVVRHGAHRDRPAALGWAAWTADGRLLHPGAPGGGVPVLAPVRPLELLVLRGTWLLLAPREGSPVPALTPLSASTR